MHNLIHIPAGSVDALTSAMSRPKFLTAVEREFFRCRRHEKTSALVFLAPDDLDVDDDQPEVAEQILEGVARACIANLRQTESFGHLSYREFGLLLPGANLEEAVACARRLRSTIQRLPITFVGAPAVVTASLGSCDGNERPRNTTNVVRGRRHCRLSSEVCWRE